MRAVFLGESSGGSGGVKRKCTGTGCSTVLLSAKVVQALNLNFEDIHSHVQAQQRFNGSTGIGPNYDALMARRNALLMLQNRSLKADHAINPSS
ncbi:hypothetical protein QYF36_013040 [Acer negundo]|nr:hypothetical protein QYF36_013040 [Acer negundo]